MRQKSGRDVSFLVLTFSNRRWGPLHFGVENMTSVVTMIRNGVATVIDATIRQPHAISINESDDLYARKPVARAQMAHLMTPVQPCPKSADCAQGKSQEQIEYDTLSRIRAAIYPDG